MCRCRDTGSKHCRVEHRQDTWIWNLKLQTRLDRKRTNQSLVRVLEDLSD